MAVMPEYSTTAGVALPDSDRVTSSAWKALAGSALGYAMDGFDLLILGFMLRIISIDLHLSPADKGLMVATPVLAGAFLRVIPLPEGAIVDQAKATFRDGVLEITVPAPPEHVSRGRRLEISRGDGANSSTAKDQSTRDNYRP